MKPTIDDGDEYVTIVGASLEELQSAFSAHDLGARDFLILHKIGRHRLIDGRECASGLGSHLLFAATYRRKAIAN